jgi:hypothetical protein
MIPHPGFGCIVTLDSGALLKVQQYLITIGKRGQWTNCKHLYFVFTVIGSLDSDRDAFVHVPSFSFNEVKRILKSGILANRIP